MNTRFELLIPVDRRLELDRVAAETGLSASDIARHGIRWVLEHRDVLLKLPTEAPHA
jgi:hypothetical protein